MCDVVALTPRELVPISSCVLLPDRPLGIDVYLIKAIDSKPVLFCSRDQTLSEAKLDTVAQRLPGRLYVRCSDADRLQAYIREHWSDILRDDSRPLEDRTRLMCNVMRDVLADAFASRNIQRIAATADFLAAESTRLLQDAPVAIGELSKIMQHDFATFTHSTNVALYSLRLAQELGFSTDEQQCIVRGALLHDVGKLEITENILSKPDRLTQEELRQIRQHPTTGLEQLVDQALTFGELMIVYQHHERIDGSGYPVGSVGEEIHPFARLCAITDVYEALTAHRPYRRALRAKAAMHVLQRKEGVHFDREMLACWKGLVEV